MPLFRRDTELDLDAIAAAERALNEQIAATTATIAEHSLSDLRDGNDRAAQASRQLVELEAKRRVILAAGDEARRKAEADAVAREKREAAARLRAFRAHLSRIERHGREAADALAGLMTAWGKLAGAAASARAMLPGAAALSHDFAGLSELRLGGAIGTELGRIGQRHTAVGPQPIMSLVPRLAAGTQVDTVKPLGDALAEAVRWTADRYRDLLGLDNETETAPRRGGEGAGDTGRTAAPSPPVSNVAPAPDEPPAAGRRYSITAEEMRAR